MTDVWSEYAYWSNKRDQYGEPYGSWIPDRPLEMRCDQAARNLAFGLAIVAAYVAGRAMQRQINAGWITWP